MCVHKTENDLTKKGLHSVVFTKAENWNQPRWSTDEWIMKILHIHKMQCYSALKKNEITKFAENG